MDINPKQFVKSNSLEKFPLSSDDFGSEKEDDDPLSIKDISSIVIGVILAILTVFLPAISVLLDRPLLPKTGVIYKQMVNKDGY